MKKNVVQIFSGSFGIKKSTNISVLFRTEEGGFELFSYKSLQIHKMRDMPDKIYKNLRYISVGLYVLFISYNRY